MNRNGFTIIEVLGVIVLISIVTIVISFYVRSSMAIGVENSYKLMKNNLVSVSYSYIQECEQGMITCDFSFDNNNTFKAYSLLNSGYVNSLESPIDGKYLGDCLVFYVKKENGVTIVDLKDSCY